MEEEYTLSVNVKPIEIGDATNPAKVSRIHSLFAALESALTILGEPYDYNFLMGISGHAFRLMIYKSGIYVEQPDDCQTHYFKFHTLEAIGYQEKMGSQFCDGAGYKDEEITSAIKDSLAKGIPALIWHSHPYWGVVIGYKDQSFIINAGNGERIKLEKIKASGFHIFKKTAGANLGASVRNSFKIVLDYAFRKRMPKGSTSWFHKNFSGLAAYERWISHLKHKRVEDSHSNWWNYVTLLDSRKAALAHLKDIRKFYANQALEEINVLFDKYEMIGNYLHQNLIYFPKDNVTSTTEEGAITALKRIAEMEKEAFKFIKTSKLCD